MRRRIGVSAAVALTLVLGGCAANAPDAAAPAAGLPEGVTVSFRQLRSDVAVRQAQVEVVNRTDALLIVGEVRVDDPRFDGPAVRVVARESRVAPGSTVDIRVQLPPVACSGSIPDEAAAELTLELSSGHENVEATAPMADPLGFVAGLHERECRAARLMEAAALSFTGFAPSPTGTAAALELTVVPTGEGAAVVRGIETTNLLAFGKSAVDTVETYPLDLTIDADSEPAVVSLPLLPLRCDPHAVQEDKRGTIFTLVVEVDGVAGDIELAAPQDLKGRILSWVGDWCGFGPG